jgi:hypothetical protein
MTKRLVLLSSTALSGIQPRPDFDPAEPDARAWTEAIAEAVRRGLLEPIGVNCDGKTIYQRTEKLGQHDTAPDTDWRPPGGNGHR